MLIVALLVLGIGFMHNIMNFLLGVLDVLNKFGFLEELHQWGPMVGIQRTPE
jgi:hypothetical protein